MIIAVDIGNTCIKCGIFLPTGVSKVTRNTIPQEDRIDEEFVQNLIQWHALSKSEMLSPFIWRVAQTGLFPWKKVQTEIRKKRPQDRFEILTYGQIPLKMDVDSPEKVGIDRLLAALAARRLRGNSPILVVDAGTAITIDVVQNRTFCGGAILPGLPTQAKTYPKMSPKLPLIQFAREFVMEPASPGRNTKDAIYNGLYWGTIGTIRLFYEMFFPKKRNVQLFLTGGDGAFLVPGLLRVLSHEKIAYHPNLVLEGIDQLPVDSMDKFAAALK